MATFMGGYDASMLRAPIDAPLQDDFVAQHPPERLQRIQLLRTLCLGLLLGLIALGLAWELKLAPLPGGTGALAIKVLPLCLAVMGMAKHRMYTFRWMSLLIWLYFTEGVVRGTSDAGVSQVCAWIEIALSTGLFIGCSVYVRLRLKVLPPKPGKADKKAAAAQASPAERP
jgi:uncharacterized membrane protein